MQVVILAGGLGTRLRPITHSVPKPMVLIHGRPYLEYQINFLRSLGLSNILILVGRLGEQITSYFKDGSDFGVNIQYSKEEVSCGTGGALKLARDKLDECFLLIYGDSFLPIDYRVLIDCFNRSGKKGLVVAYDNSENAGVRGNLCVQDNIVSRYEKNSDADDLKYVESGVLILKKDVLDTVFNNSAAVISLESEVFPKIIERRELCAYLTKQRFYDIGTPQGLLKASQYFQKIDGAASLNSGLLDGTSITVILPTYNEEKNIGEIVWKVHDYLKSRFVDYEILVVDGDSKDRTQEIILEFQKNIAGLKLFVKGVGYANALRLGFRNSAKDLIFYMDSDGQFDINELDLLLPLIKDNDIVTGYRIKRNDPVLRIWMAKVYNSVCRMLFGLRLRDIDCAFKLYRKRVFEKIKLRTDINAGVINAEIFTKSINQGFRISEVGVNHYPRIKGATRFSNKMGFVKPKIVLGFILDTLKIWLEIKRTK